MTRHMNEKEATTEERRTVLVQLVNQVYLKHDALLGIRPTLRAWPLMHAVYVHMTRTIFCHRSGTISCPKIRHLCIIIVNLASITGTIFCQKVKIGGHILSESYGPI